MSLELFNHNPDLKRLRDEGYFVQTEGGLLILRDVPYVNSQRQVRKGTLISDLVLTGDRTCKPSSHVVHFDGDYPCYADGHPIEQIRNESKRFDLGHGITARHRFSSKPHGGYKDYHHKMKTYANILAGPAASINPEISPRTFRTPDEEEASVFNYTETASGRAGIGALTEKLAGEIVAIIGLGGTGSYVLDLVAKTPVQEIRLFDDDEFLQHNAFRAPGAPSLEQLRDAPQKVDYLKAIYSKMHRGISAHAISIGKDNSNLLNGVTFAFICIDGGQAKRLLIEKLESIGASFVDVGMGLELTDGSLGGILRVTTSTPEKRDHIHNGRISFDDYQEENLYSSNIQVADLNMMNASQAVHKWKKIRGFYRDYECEYHCTYTTDGNQLENSEQPQ